MKLSRKYDSFENMTVGGNCIWKKYVSATMDWTLKIEVSGDSSGKILKEAILTAHILARTLISWVPLIVKPNCWRAS